MVLEFDIEKDCPEAEDLLYGIDIAVENRVCEYGSLSKNDIKEIVKDELSRYDLTELISFNDIEEQLVRTFTKYAIEVAEQDGYISNRRR